MLRPQGNCAHHLVTAGADAPTAAGGAKPTTSLEEKFFLADVAIEPVTIGPHRGPEALLGESPERVGVLLDESRRSRLCRRSPLQHRGGGSYIKEFFSVGVKFSVRNTFS